MLQLVRTPCLQKGSPSLRLHPVPFARASIRGLSINSAIHRGIRESRDPPISHGRPHSPYVRNGAEEFRDGPLKENRREMSQHQTFDAFFERKARNKMVETAYGPDPAGDAETYGDQTREVDDYDGRWKPLGPLAIPHKTAASQFIYGFSAVFAALTAKRRQFYTLYLHKRAAKRVQGDDEASMQKLLTALPRAAIDEVINVEDDKLPMLDQMSEGRPHNGVVLEASPLPIASAKALDVATRKRPYFTVFSDSSPVEARRGNKDPRFAYNSHGWRFPFILYLDGIKDSGNLGAIIRSAYYLGVDAVFTSARCSAPVDSVTIKTSAGAAEIVPICTVLRPNDFLDQSHQHGWRIYAADAPEPPEDNFNVHGSHMRRSLDPENTSPLLQVRRRGDPRILPMHSPLLFHPTILMMGGESEGLMLSLKRRADYLVGIRGVKGEAIGVDSLNVSVAAAMLSLEFLKKPTNSSMKQARERFARLTKPERDDGFIF